MISYIDRESGNTLQEHPKGHRWLKFLYNNPIGRATLYVLVKRKLLSSLVGRHMNSISSKGDIKQFVKENQIDMEEYLLPIDKFKSFNEFFYRKIKPERRPINDNIISPSDGRIVAFNPIDNQREFFIKGSKFTLKRFLRSKRLAEKYRDGVMYIVRLAPIDYHRFHFPYSGTISQTNIIKGSYKSVSPIALKQCLSTLYQNKRSIATLKTKEYGNILISEVGATMVGSIIQTYTPGECVIKGEEKGYFAFGGSTVVLLFEKGKIIPSDDIIENTKKGYETFVKMGETIGSATNSEQN